MLTYKLKSIAGMVVILAGIVAATNTSYAASGKVTMKLIKAAFVIGGTGGKGTVTFEGKTYPIRIGGISAGWQISLSALDLKGSIKHLNRLEDVEGIYSAAEAGLAIATGAKTAVMVNKNGVTMTLVGVQMGVDVSLNLEGLSVKLSR